MINTWKEFMKDENIETAINTEQLMRDKNIADVRIEPKNNVIFSAYLEYIGEVNFGYLQIDSGIKNAKEVAYQNATPIYEEDYGVIKLVFSNIEKLNSLLKVLEVLKGEMINQNKIS